MQLNSQFWAALSLRLDSDSVSTDLEHLIWS